jgi:two-component system LytT family sensor kinase
MRKPLPRIFIPTVSITILKAVLNKLTSLGAWDSQMVCLYKKITIIGAVEYICLMKKNSLFLYYLLVWACLALYLYIDNIANGRGTQPYVWSNLLACYFSFSFCFFGIYPFLLRRKRIHLLIIGLIIAEILFVACRYLIEEVIYLWLLGYGNYDPDVKLTHYLYDNWWRALQPILFSFIAWALLDTFKKERETEQLRKEKIQAELLFLKTQINPHFLYNTLNYMYSLAYPVSDVLANGIIKLSQLMRYMLHNSSDGLIDLKLEIAYIQNYIEIYKLRFGDNFFVNFNINGNIDKQRIASLILIPFVENAFKHGVLDNAANPIMITIDVNDNEFQLRVLNTINYGEKDDTSGIGMANIKRRLSLIYPDAHSLQIVEQKQTYAVSLHIKLS